MTTGFLIDRLPDRLRASWARPSSVLYLAAGSISVGVYFLVPEKPKDVLYVGIGLSAVVAIFVGTKNLVAEGLAWRLFALGLLCEVAGDMYTSVYEIHFGGEPGVPSVADFFYLGGYPLLVLGIFLLLRQRGGVATRAGILDTVIVFAAVGTVQWMFFVEPYRHQALGTSARIVSMAYPSMDVLLLVALAQLMIGRGQRTFASWLLLVSVAVWVVGDEVYAINVDTYRAGDWVDMFWLTSYVAWGAAALALPPDGSPAPQERRRLPRLTRGRLALLAAALLAVPVALVVERVAENRFHPVAAAIGSAAIAVLVLVRLAGLVSLVDQARIAERNARHEADLARKGIEEQNATLLDLDRLKDELLSSVSHELRTPLTSISGYVELLLEETGEQDERRHLQIVQRNTGRLLRLVSDLLLAARLQSGHLDLQRAPVDLRVLIEQAVDAARPHADAAGVGLRVHAEDVPSLDGDWDRLAQLVDNLVSNAIKFTPAGGEVEVALASQDGVVCIEVSDTGMGLAQDELGQLFTRFYRARSAVDAHVPGTGLGLFIAKAIVDAHGGSIAVRSSVGEGTTFVVELPASYVLR